MEWRNEVLGLKDHMLTSESLIDRMPDLEDKVVEEEEGLFICTLVLPGDEVFLTGRVSGLSMDSPEEFKVDFRVEVGEAFAFTQEFVRGTKCRAVFFRRGPEIIQLDGPFDVTSSKVIDFDSASKSCTLGVDMSKRKKP